MKVDSSNMVAHNNKYYGQNIITLWEMLTSALRALVNNPVKENFYWKRKKKQLMFWEFFSFSIKVMSKLS